MISYENELLIFDNIEHAICDFDYELEKELEMNPKYFNQSIIKIDNLELNLQKAILYIEFYQVNDITSYKKKKELQKHLTVGINQLKNLVIKECEYNQNMIKIKKSKLKVINVLENNLILDSLKNVKILNLINNNLSMELLKYILKQCNNRRSEINKTEIRKRVF